jgi:outer membrane protein assembly factor BamB
MGNPVASAPVVVDNLIVFATREGSLYKINTTTMDKTQIIDLKTTIDGPLMAYKGIIYVHPQAALMLLIDPVSGKQVGTISLES